MAVNKVEVNGETKLDLTQDTVTPESLLFGVTAHNSAGVQIVGKYQSVTLTGLEITTPPTKTDYKPGEIFDPTGMVVTATYSNGAKLENPAYTVAPSGALAVGTTTVTITYSEGGITKTATQAISVTRTVLTVPTQSGSLTYTGGAQSPAWSNYDADKMTLGGVTSGTNAGSYNATFTIKNTALYCWPDGSTAAKTVAWTIGKAAGTLTLSKTEVTLKPDTTSDSFTVTTNSAGAVSVESSAPDTVAVRLDGDTVTVTSVGNKNGTAVITVSVAEDENHTTPASKTCLVTASFKSAASASTSPAAGVSYTSGLSGLSAEDVTAFAEAISNNSSITNATSTVYVDFGSIHRKISVGDQITLPLNGTNYAFDVIGFNHDELTTPTAYGGATATGKAGITFQMHDLFVTNFAMNDSRTNAGGWKSSKMRTSTMVTMKGYLPSAWQTAIKSVNKLSGVGGGASSGTEVVSDDCFLLAEGEIFGPGYGYGGRGYSFDDECANVTQYAYYKAGNSRVKNQNSSANIWWERSSLSGSGEGFCRVGGNGDVGNNDANFTRGVAFGFCF